MRGKIRRVLHLLFIERVKLHDLLVIACVLTVKSSNYV